MSRKLMKIYLSYDSYSVSNVFRPQNFHPQIRKTAIIGGFLLTFW